MSTTPVATPKRPIARVRHAGRSLKHVFDEMVAAREVGLGRPRR